MSTSWNASNVLCPFYISEEKNKINCENLLSHSNGITHRFENRPEKSRHMARCCCKDYKRCLYYRVLSRDKYNEAEEK